MNIKKIIVDIQFRIHPVWRLRKSGARIGDNVFIGENVYIELENALLLTVKNNAVISSHTKIVFHDSSVNNTLGGPIKYGKVIIGENSYIGLDTLILPGTVIGKNCIVGAGSLVKGKLRNNGVYVGRPAIRIGSIYEIESKWKKAKNTGLTYLMKAKKWYERTDK